MNRMIMRHPEDDGQCRVVPVKTSHRLLKQTVSRICKLPIDPKDDNKFYKIVN